MSDRDDDRHESGEDLRYRAEARQKVKRFVQRIAIGNDYSATGLRLGGSVGKEEMRLTCFQFPVRLRDVCALHIGVHVWSPSCPNVVLDCFARRKGHSD